MPDKGYKSHRCGSKRCVKCWENKINHANKRKISDAEWNKEKDETNRNPFFQFLRAHTMPNDEIMPGDENMDLLFDFNMYDTFKAWYRETHPEDGDAVPSITQFRNGLRLHVPLSNHGEFQDSYKLRLI